MRPRWIATFLALAGSLPAAAIVASAPHAIAQESGMPPPDPTAPPVDAPAPPRSPEDEARRAQAVARVGDVAITVGQLEDEIARQTPFMRARFRDRHELEELLDTLVRFEMLAREADRRGLGTDPEVREAVAQSAVQHMIRRDFDERITVESIPQADVQAYYDGHPDEFSRPEVRRASQIVLESEEQARALVEEARAADARRFRQLAQERSIDPESRQRGGDLRYFDDHGVSPNSADPAVDEAIVRATFALTNVGDVGDPIRIGGEGENQRWAIVKLTGLRPAEHRSVEDAGQGIRLRLWRTRRQEALEGFVEELRGRIHTEVHYERMAGIRFDPPERLSSDPHAEGADEEGAEGEGTEGESELGPVAPRGGAPDPHEGLDLAPATPQPEED
ncbi:MAG: peptidyl-prolyl cis-trans isomerase [Sandaracinus sp.]